MISCSSICRLFLVVALFTRSTEAFNRSLFFRSSSFWDEPRFERSWLSTADVQILGGGNHLGKNGCGKRVPLLGIYGPENVTALSAVTPGNPLILPGNPHTIRFQSVADVFEADFNLYQNFCNGFFTQFHFPIILLQIYPSGFCEGSDTSKKYHPAWQQTLESLARFLKPYDLNVCPHRNAAPSDSTLFVGWTHSYEDTTFLDFIDVTAKTGVLFPTGKKKSLSTLFDIPYGYNGHWAIPLSGDISFGVYDWLTVGLHGDNLLFFNRTECIRLKTDEEADTGLIVLGKGKAEVHHGMVWRLGAYAKADHFFSGLSLLMAFSYERQNKDTVYPCNRQFNIRHVNQNEQLRAWSRSIFHIMAEWDFATCDSWYGPRIGIFYDKQITGKRVFDISMIGGYLGLDINWCF